MSRLTAPEKQPPSTPRNDLGKKTKIHTRYFTKDGKQVPGVTSVTGILDKPQLKNWAWKMGLKGEDIYRFTEEAASIGSCAHELIAEAVGGPPAELGKYSPDQLARAQYSLNVFEKWRADHEIEPILVEAKLVSEKHLYGGTVDLVATIDGQKELIDIKTGSGVYLEHHYQVGGGYWNLLREHGHQVKGVRILRVGRTEGEGLDEKRLTGLQVLHAWKVFELTLALYRLTKGDR